MIQAPVQSIAFVAVIVVSSAIPWPTRAAAPNAPKVMRLWEGNAPGAMGKEDADIPTMTLYPAPADKANGAAMVICPGGGYQMHYGPETTPVAEWFNSLGVTAVVLKYRLGPKYHHPVELGDVSRTIRTVRSRAGDWKIDPHRIGVIGFSAGGHLASSADTHFDDGEPSSADPIDRVSSRPDLAILVYPVITMNPPFAHLGSHRNLLGDNPSPDLIELMSSEKQVTDKTPPTFLVASEDDTVVPVENSILFYEALKAHHVPAELHLFEHGVHGFVLGGNDPGLQWPKMCVGWLEHRGFLK